MSDDLIRKGPRYALLRARKSGQLFRIRIAREDEQILAGYQVKPDGDLIERETKEAIQHFLVIAHPREKVCDLFMSRHYGCLVRENNEE